MRLMVSLWSGLWLSSLLLIACARGREEEGDRESVAMPVAAIQMLPTDLSRPLRVTGEIEPRARVDVASRADGLVEAVHVEEGDRVTKGDLLAVIDRDEARSERRRIQAMEERARLEYDRMKRLYEQGHISEAERQAARADWQVLESELELWNTRIEFGRIVAPADGAIVQRLIEPGESVQAREKVFALITYSDLLVHVQLSEFDAVHVNVGDVFDVHVDAIPEQTFAARVERVVPAIQPGRRLVRVVLALPEEAFQDGARPGFTARVSGVIDPRPGVLALPTASIGFTTDERYVFVIVDDMLERRAVQTGITRKERTEILAGLKEGEWVLATNPREMRDGQRVRVVRELD